MGYTIYTACKLYAENNYYNGGTGKGSVVNDSVSSNDISSKYPGQYTEVGSTLTGFKYSLTAKTAKPCNWRPSSNYVYNVKSAADAKSYCERYSGPQSSAANMTYAVFAKAGYPSAGYITAPSEKMEEPVQTTTTTTTTAAVTSETQNLEPEDFNFSGKVYLVGDSTVCHYDENYSIPYNRYGWGMKFAEQFNGVEVINLALSGRSSRSFLAEKNYQTLKSSLGKGDYLFIQFGHNDEKTDESVYPGLGTYPGLDWSTLDTSGKDSQGRYSYEYLLTAYYINLAKNKGAVPVLVTPITRRNIDGTPNYQQHTAYQQGMITLGKLYNVPVIDMTKLTTQLYTNLYNYGGAAETAKMHCYTDTNQTTLDNTHLSNAGAYKIANMIAEETQKQGLSIGKLKNNYIKKAEVSITGQPRFFA